MRRLFGPLTLGLFISSLAFTAACNKLGKEDNKLNVLFIAIDDLRPELGAYGHPLVHSPNIDEIANRGITYENAYVQQAVCNPSRASIMTGLRPDALKVWDLQTDFRQTRPKVTTLSQHFMNNGYHASAIGKIYHNTIPDPQSWSDEKLHVSGYPFDPDAVYASQSNLAFQRKRMEEITKEGQQEKYIDQYGQWYLKAASTEDPDVEDDAYYDGAQTTMALNKIEELSKLSKPFFFAIGYYRPHLPFAAPKKYWDLYNAEDIQLAENTAPPQDGPPMAINNMRELRGYSDFPQIPHPIDGRVNDEDARRLKHGYYASVSYVDAQIGRLLTKLNELDLSDNTVIVVFGDHGWKLGEHGSWGKMTNYEIDTRAPLIISIPGQHSGKRVKKMVEFVDLYPTLSEIAGLTIPEGLEGQSMMPLVNDDDAPWKNAVFSQFFREGIWLAPDGREYMGYSIRTAQYKYVEWVDWENRILKATELYDHQRDPQENINRASDPNYAEALADLKDRLDKGWKNALP